MSNEKPHGDNGRRARAYPRAEGECEDCKRWVPIRTNSPNNERGMPRLTRHKCMGGYMTGRRYARQVDPRITTAGS